MALEVTPALPGDPFVAQFSSEALFRRYARTRAKYMGQRITIKLLGAATLGLLVDPVLVLWPILLACMGELVDHVTMQRGLRALDEGRDVRKVLRATTRSAIFSALCHFGCGAVVWLAVPGDDAVFFCLAFLAAGIMDIGLFKSWHRSAVLWQIAVLVACGAALVGYEGFLHGLDRKMAFDIVAGLLLLFMVNIFIGNADRNFKRGRTNARDLIRRQRLIERAYAELREKQRELRLLSQVARHANDSIFITDSKGIITWANQAFSATTGYARHDAIGRRPGDLMNAPDVDRDTIREMQECLKSGRAFRGEILNRHADGHDIWIETNIVPVFGERGRPEMFVAIERDISQNKRHAEEMAKARVAAERGERAKSEFLATMSHEIRTPMNGVIGMAELLSETELTADQTECVDAICGSAQALLKIIDDILDLSKLDSGKLSVDPVDFAPGPCILDAVDLLKPSAHGKGLFLDVVFESRLPSRLHGDDGRIRQILLNLVGNAVKFTESGGVSVSVRHREVGDRVQMIIEVCDTGIGISAHKLEGIFDAFSQADTATTRQFGGTGLGLTISRLLAEQMGGGISVTSREGEGATFAVELSLAQEKGVPELQAEHTGPVDISLLAGMRVLMAEDNRTNRRLVEKYLESYPVELRSVENGREAVEAVKQGGVEVLLMDMSMPEMDGLEATRVIRRLPVAQPHIIALTANAYASDREQCLGAGMDDFLSKPVRRPALAQALVRAAQSFQRRAQQSSARQAR